MLAVGSRDEALPLTSSLPPPPIIPIPRSVRELLDSATKRISYLKMVTPRDPREADLASPSKRYVVGAGGALEFAGGGEGDVGDVRAGVRAAKGKGGLDAADFKRHEASLRRFRFEDRGSSPRSPLGR